MNDDFADTASNGILIQNDHLPLTVEDEQKFKQIGTTFVIILQILITVSIFLNKYIFNFEYTKKELVYFKTSGLYFILFIDIT